MMGEIFFTDIDIEIIECPEEKSNKEGNLMLELFTKEPKTEEKNATHRDFVKISDGKRHYFKNKVCPVDLDKKHEMKTKKAEKESRMSDISEQTVEENFIQKCKKCDLSPPRLLVEYLGDGVVSLA